MASNIIEYTLSLNDKMSDKLQKIGVNSDDALNIFARLEKQSEDVSRRMGTMGRSVGTLSDKLALLKAERDWIPESDIAGIRKYNTEIHSLEKNITKLQTINGSKFGSNLNQAISNLPFGALLTNPVAQAGAAILGAGKMSLAFSENLAQVNTTAQLSKTELDALGSKLKAIGVSAGADLSGVPIAFEKILSQTGDTDLSLSILKQTLKGAEAGFTDTETVAGALANTLSLVGKENTNAEEVLDTLFAAKRVGAGEFKDFAQYIPGLVASGQSLGKGYKETAGVFAYMTGKGLEASKAATLMENAYSALGKSDITEGLEGAGISIYDEDGAMRQMDEIMTSMSAKLAEFGTDDRAKSNFLESIGLRDVQAKQAFMVLSSESDKLTEAIKATADAAGEADRAFAMGESPMRKMRQLWSAMQYIIIGVGDVLTAVMYPALYAVTAIVTSTSGAIQWLVSGLEAGNTAALLAAAGIGALTIGMTVNYLLTKRAVIQAALVNAWNVTQAVTMGILTGAIWAQNAAWMANPVGLIVMAVAALIAGIVIVVKNTEGWRATWDNAMSVMGDTVSIVADKFMIAFNKMRQSWYSFKESMGLGDSAENQSAIAQLEKDTADRMAAIEGARKRRAETDVWKVEWKEDEASANSISPSGSSPSGGLAGALPTSPTSTSSSATGGMSSTAGGGSGGGKDIKITIGNLIGKIEMKGTSGEDMAGFERKVQEALLRILNMASVQG